MFKGSHSLQLHLESILTLYQHFFYMTCPLSIFSTLLFTTLPWAPSFGHTILQSVLLTKWTFGRVLSKSLLYPLIYSSILNTSSSSSSSFHLTFLIMLIIQNYVYYIRYVYYLFSHLISERVLKTTTLLIFFMFLSSMPRTVSSMFLKCDEVLIIWMKILGRGADVWSHYEENHYGRK
jgi:hypothetical protein